MMRDSIRIGFVEKVTIYGASKKKKALARIDTGAQNSSIDMALVKELNLGPTVREARIKSANGIKIRPVIMVEFEIEGKKMKSQFTIADRTHLKYNVLIGRNVIREGFIIDPSLSPVDDSDDEPEED